MFRFIVGLALGTVIGFFLCALLSANGRDNE